jgi:hypothetical protein
VPSRPQLAALLEQRQQIGKAAAGRGQIKALAESMALPPPRATITGTSAWSRCTCSYSGASHCTSGLGDAVDHAAQLRSQQLAHALHQAQAFSLGKVTSRQLRPASRAGS